MIQTLFDSLTAVHNQGVRQSGAVSSCLRFSIEMARQIAYDAAGLDVAASDQTSVTAIWRRRCERKLQQLAVCEVYGVFKLKDVSTGCNFQVDDFFIDYETGIPSYTITPSCLVLYGKNLYDPCGCNNKWCSPRPEKLNLLTLTPACVIKHARDLVIDVATGLPSWPVISDSPVPVALARLFQFMRYLPTATDPCFRSSFYDTVLVAPGNVANNPAEHWATIEGNVSSLYCDVVVDWWPDTWRHPVGYHVTLPCTGAVHRTFDASWAALRVGAQVTMMHVPDALRNNSMQNNQFGAAGACR